MSKPPPVYLDHNATSPLRDVALQAMLPWLQGVTGNPSSVHQDGSRARAGLERSRAVVADSLGVAAEDLVFTSGGTESNNLAVTAFLARHDHDDRPRVHAVTASIEHPSVLAPLTTRAERGEIDLTLVHPDASGLVSPDALRAALRPDTVLVTLQFCNHETGAVQSLVDLVAVARAAAPSCRFHCDAVQALGKLPLHVEDLGVDSVAVSAHKAGGPVGIGALALTRGVPLAAMLLGGSQEYGRRAGTASVALAAGFAAAVEEAALLREQREDRHRSLKERLLTRLAARHPDHVINSPPRAVAPGTLNVSFPGCDRESLLVNLDLLGIRVSAGAACASGAMENSPVLLAMGLDDKIAHSAIRFSFGPDTEPDDIDRLGDALDVAVPRARQKPTFF